ncbi:hypothetical protein ACI797_08510 [Geodermatophilus sp. SYSU D00691]
MSGIPVNRNDARGRPADLPGPTTRSWLGVAVPAVGGLLVGLVVGGGGDILSGGGPAGGDSAAPVAVGPVEEAPTETPAFVLRIFNPGEHDIEVTLVEVAGWAPDRSTTASVGAGSWGLVEFSAPVDCHRAVRDVRSVHVRVRSSSGVTERELPLPVSAGTLLDYHEAVCAPPAPLTADELAGVWLLEEVYGSFKSGESVHMIRFDPDGTYVMDPQGGLFTGRPAVRGSYRVDGAVLTTTAEGGWACGAGPGETATWLASIPADGELRLALQPGSRCPEGDGDVWLTRRVLLAPGLPSPTPGSVPAAD